MAEHLNSKQIVCGSSPLTRFMNGIAKKRCARCHREKPLSDFRKKHRQVHQPYCRPCQAEYHREHYLKNAAAYKASAKRRLERMKKILRVGKSRPCADCRVQYPYYVMDYDHKDRSKKLDSVTQLVWESEQTLRDEIAKCDVVCANCHRIRTYGRSDTK